MQAIILLQTLLYALDSFPLLPSLFSILCHLVYLQNFSSSWPLISLTSPSFLASCLLVLVDHFVWFWHFSSLANGGGTGGGWKGSKVAGGSPYARPSYAHTMHGSGRGGGESLAFVDVASFFGEFAYFQGNYYSLGERAAGWMSMVEGQKQGFRLTHLSLLAPFVPSSTGRHLRLVHPPVPLPFPLRKRQRPPDPIRFPSFLSLPNLLPIQTETEIETLLSHLPRPHSRPLPYS
jgi:hypothetical protein